MMVPLELSEVDYGTLSLEMLRGFVDIIGDIMIIVYGKPDCSQCVSLKKALDKIDKDYEYKDISVDQNAFEELVNNGLRSLPQVKMNGEFLKNIMEVV